LLLAGLLKPSFIPSREQRELRDLTRYRWKLIEQIASEKNRVIRLLEDCNIKLSSVLSDTHGAVGTKLIDKLCKTGKVSMEDIEEMYHGKLKASKDEIYRVLRTQYKYAACEWVVTKHHVFMLQRIKENIFSCEASISKNNLQIKAILSPYQNVLELLKAVPGLDTKSSEDLIAEIGLDTRAERSEV